MTLHLGHGASPTYTPFATNRTSRVADLRLLQPSSAAATTYETPYKQEDGHSPPALNQSERRLEQEPGLTDLAEGLNRAKHGLRELVLGYIGMPGHGAGVGVGVGGAWGCGHGANS